MNRAVFADTSYYLALMFATDHAHALADAELDSDRTIVTTECIILELGNACHAARDHADFLDLVAGMRASKKVRIIPFTTELLIRGLRLMEERPDKDWSLTDCISFVAMEDEGLRDALTTDRHFEQAGFTAILR